jgi:hypothetical protein
MWWLWLLGAGAGVALVASRRSSSDAVPLTSDGRPVFAPSAPSASSATSSPRAAQDAPILSDATVSAAAKIALAKETDPERLEDFGGALIVAGWPTTGKELVARSAAMLAAATSGKPSTSSRSSGDASRAAARDDVGRWVKKYVGHASDSNADVERAARFAIAHETDPRKLVIFGTSLIAGGWPKTGSLVLAASSKAIGAEAEAHA